MGVVVVVLVTAVGQSFSSVPMLFATPIYYGEFKDSAGIKPGDKVRIDGIDTGLVRSLDIDGDHITVGFSLADTVIGSESRLAIRTDTILGRKSIAVEPRGARPLRANGIVPMTQTSTPYQLSEALFDVTKATSGWDLDTVRQSLNVLSETIDQTAPHLSAALDGVKRLSNTVAARDDDIKQLLTRTNKIATILGDRSEQINSVVLNTRSLLAAFNSRGEVIDYLLQNVTALSNQLAGVITDNPNLNHVFEQLRAITDQLEKHKFDIADALTTLSQASAAVSESVASGPYFKVLVANLLPGQVLQPFIDAAFKKRGIQPEEFWRNAGLPAFRFPDPNGTRFPNGAPPPGPVPLEGTPENPGPAVPAGSPCSYTPPADGLPTPTDPLPCAHLDQGPFGPVPGGFAPPQVATSAPNPDGLPPLPGLSIAGVAGLPPPVVPGTPVPLPPAPPGARTTPLNPVVGADPPPAFAPTDMPDPDDSGGH
jgi:phospholipid/cholesterol/gamma-HCH transport system substrate-binding protein